MAFPYLILISLPATFSEWYSHYSSTSSPDKPAGHARLLSDTLVVKHLQDFLGFPPGKSEYLLVSKAFYPLFLFLVILKLCNIKESPLNQKTENPSQRLLTKDIRKSVLAGKVVKRQKWFSNEGCGISSANLHIEDKSGPRRTADTRWLLNRQEWASSMPEIN